MKILLSGNLVRFADYVHEVDVDADTVDGALRRLVERFPPLKPVVFQPDGRVRSAHRVFHNGSLLDGDLAARPCAAGDELSILTAIAGG